MRRAFKMLGLFAFTVLLCQKVESVPTKEPNSLVLLGKLTNGQLELRCATTEVEKAITWNTPIEEKFIISAQFNAHTAPTSEKWLLESSLKNNYGVILDERWEAFPLEYTDSDEPVKYTINNEPWFIPTNHYIPISVKLKTEGHIYICRNQYAKSLSYCYLLILKESMSQLRKCVGTTSYSMKAYFENCQMILTQNNSTKLNENDWTHLTFILDINKKSISVYFYGEETPLLHYLDDLVHGVEYIYFDSLEDVGFWKLHSYEVYALTDQEKNAEHFVTSFFPNGNSLCLTMQVLICDTCTIAVYLRDKNNSTIYEEKYLKEKGSAWQKIKISALKVKGSQEYKLWIKIMGELRDGDQISLSYIEEVSTTNCFQKKEKYSIMRIDPEDQHRVSCQYLLNELKDKETDVIKIQEPSPLIENHCKPEEVGSMCLSCFSIYKQQCEATIICENTGCYCSPGYEGFLCNFPLGNVGYITWNSSETSISLEWKAPKQTNGNIVEYIISYRQIPYPWCVPRDEENNLSGEVLIKTTKFVLENLHPYSNYSIRIAPSRKLMEEVPETFISTKSTDLPEKDAVVINITEISTNLIKLNTKYNCEKSKGPFKIGYVFNCKHWCHSDTSGYFNPIDSVYSIEGLHAFTEYKFEFYLLQDYHTLDLFETTFTTKPGTPEPTTSFEVYETGLGSLLMRWAPPEPTGIIERTSISGRYWNEYETFPLGPIDVIFQICKVWTDLMCAELKDVRDWFKYEISIKFKNENVDTWSIPTTIHVVATVTGPESPNILVAMWDNGFNFTLRWQHPDKTNGRLLYFAIRRNSEEFYKFEVKEYNLTYEITQEMHPESPTYTFELYAVNAAFNSSPSIKSVLNPPKRPKIIQEISYKEHTNNTIKVFIPAPIDVQYISFTYIIVSEYESKDCNQSNSTSQFFNECTAWFAKEIQYQQKQEEIVIGDESSQRSYSLNETIINRALNLYTKYNISVVIVNNNNNIKRFSVTNALTVLLAPTKVMLPCYTSCTIRFKAKKHLGSSTNVYLIRYKKKDQTIWTNSSELSFRKDFEILHEFKKSTSYILRIYLFKGEELELQKPELNFTTSCRHVQLENISLIVANISADLNLNYGYQEEICNLDNYKIIVPGSIYNKTLKPFNKIENLKPMTTYNISITGKSYNLSTDFTTSEGSPEKVRNIAWNSSDTTISLEWKKPSITNGKLLGYKISYQHSLYKSCIYIESDDDSRGEITTRNTRIVMENLNPNSNYTVSIAAFTKLPGELLEIEVSTKPRDELDKDAYMISASEYGTTIGLHFWPNCAKIKGPVRIGVILDCTQNWCNKTTNITIDPLLISYTLPDLLPFTEYRLKFILLNSVQSIDLFTKTVKTMTAQPGIPGPVRYFQAYEKGNNRILMHWKPPEPPTGNIENYFFSAEYYNDGIWIDSAIKASETYKCGTDMLCVEIKGVSNELRYRITIAVKNIGVDKRSEPVTTDVTAMEEKRSNSIYVCLILMLLIPLVQIYRRKTTASTEYGKSPNESLQDPDDLGSNSTLF